MKIWESPDKGKNRYRGGAALKAAGIAVVMMALTVITVALSFFLSASSLHQNFNVIKYMRT